MYIDISQTICKSSKGFLDSYLPCGPEVLLKVVKNIYDYPISLKTSCLEMTNNGAKYKQKQYSIISRQIERII